MANVETFNSMADANTIFEALRYEQKFLYSSWNEVIIAIQNHNNNNWDDFNGSLLSLHK